MSSDSLMTVTAHGGFSTCSSSTCSLPPVSPKVSPARLYQQPQTPPLKRPRLRGLTHPSKAGCDFLGIVAQAPVWAELLRKACFVHHSVSSCLSSRNTTRLRPAQNGTSSQAPSSISSPLIIQLLHKIC